MHESQLYQAHCLKVSAAVCRDQLADKYKEMIKNYPMIFIEDPFDQDDWEHFAKITADNLVPVRNPS
jgi:enolase